MTHTCRANNTPWHILVMLYLVKVWHKITQHTNIPWHVLHDVWCTMYDVCLTEDNTPTYLDIYLMHHVYIIHHTSCITEDNTPTYIPTWHILVVVTTHHDIYLSWYNTTHPHVISMLYYPHMMTLSTYIIPCHSLSIYIITCHSLLT